MTTIVLILSIVCFIVCFGLHSVIDGRADYEKPMYLSTPLALIPLISGFVLPVVSLTYLFDYHWLLLALANLVLVFILGPFVTKAYLVRRSKRYMGTDMIYSFLLGVLAMVIGIVSS